jgi:hypothetical protein
MRHIFAAAIFAIGSSFVLVALKGGDHVLAAFIAMAACSAAATMIRALGPRQLVVDHLDDVGDPTGDGGHILGVGRLRDDTF